MRGGALLLLAYSGKNLLSSEKSFVVLRQGLLPRSRLLAGNYSLQAAG